MSRKKGFKHSTKTRKKISLSNTGKKSSQWKGDKVKYQAIHSWLRTKYGKANICENKKCLKKSRQYQWALKKGENYKRDKKKFIMLCRSCHKKLDMTQKTKDKISKSLTKYFGCTIKNCKNKHLAKGYCTTHYNTVYRKHEKNIRQSGK